MKYANGGLGNPQSILASKGRRTSQSGYFLIPFTTGNPH